MSNQTIYSALISAGLTPEGACGMMSNMKAESGMKSNIAQRGMTGYSDEQYTQMADQGLLNFSSDSVGYGLCQWTYGPRKAGLREFAKAQGKSVGDEDVQVQYCIKELKEYPGVFNILTTSHDLKQCSDIVCTQFERPAYNNLDVRYKFALEFFNEFGCMNSSVIQQPSVEIPNVSIPGVSIPMSQNQNQQSSFAQHQKEFQKKPAAAQQSGPLSFTDFFSALMNPFKPTSVTSTTSATMPVLKEGDSGAGVAAVQVALKYHKIDLGTSGNLGVWEPGTTMGVKTFQQQNGLPVTGQLDGMTWAKLMV